MLTEYNMRHGKSVQWEIHGYSVQYDIYRYSVQYKIYGNILCGMMYMVKVYSISYMVIV